MIRLATITIFTALLLLWSVSVFSDSLLAAEDISCTLSTQQHSGTPHYSGRTCPIPGHRHPAGQPCPIFGQGLGHSIGQGLGLGGGHSKGQGQGQGLGGGHSKGFGLGLGGGHSKGLAGGDGPRPNRGLGLGLGREDGHGLGNRLGEGLRDGFGVGMGHDLGQRLGPDVLEEMEDIETVKLPMFIPVPVPVKVPMPVGTPPGNIVEGVFTPQQYQQVQPMVTGQGGYLMPSGQLVGPDGMPLHGQAGYPVMVGPDGMPLQGVSQGGGHSGYQLGYLYNGNGGGYGGYGGGYGYYGYPGYIPQQRIVYVPYAAPPPIYVERLAKGLPLTIPKLRRMLGDATMYEYPEMPLRTYTTRGPRDFLAPNPPGIGY